MCTRVPPTKPATPACLPQGAKNRFMSGLHVLCRMGLLRSEPPTDNVSGRAQPERMQPWPGGASSERVAKQAGSWRPVGGVHATLLQQACHPIPTLLCWPLHLQLITYSVCSTGHMKVQQQNVGDSAEVRRRAPPGRGRGLTRREARRRLYVRDTAR